MVDSLYRSIQENSFIKQNEQYKTVNFQSERERITSELRNKGIYHFNQDYVALKLTQLIPIKK